MLKFEKTIPYIFAFTLFVSATLVFSVQPMLGKMMLPHVGGAPAGWAVTMFFFQTCLLFGYGLAYLFSKLPPFLNILAILFMFVPAALFLPIAYQSGIVDSISPWAVFLQLTASTAVPFLALSTLAPGLQRIFSFSTHSTANDPYYLYAASNVGSFVGLLAYPILLEPLIGLQTQSQIWMIAFAALFACVALSTVSIFSGRRDLVNFKFKNEKTQKIGTDKTITWSRRFKWLALAAIPSSLMIGTTTEITTDIASAPMIWVLPLSLYLLTNIIAFAKRHKIDTNNLSTLHILGAVTITWLLVLENYNGAFSHYTVFVALVYMAAFTITALLLHSCLANDRPNTTKLTEFYLIMALGGALGGSFNAFIAPVLFNDVYEFQFVFILSLLLNPAFTQSLPSNLKKISYGIFMAAIAVIALIVFKENNFTIALLLFIVIFSSMHAKTLFVTATIILLFLASPLSKKNLLHIDRNFFGVVKVYEEGILDAPTKRVRALYHGTTLHGFQALDKSLAFKPLSYYGENGPVGDTFAIQKPKDIAVLGLGVGQVSCHKRRGRQYTFYEIDPHVAEVAKDYFQILEKCGHKNIIIGDGRLEFAKDENKYDMVMIDTFSSDSIPIHLITSEAIELYMSKIKNNGVILINISNRHLDLTKPLASISNHLGYIYRFKFNKSKPEDPYNFASEWVVITKNKNIAKSLDNKGWTEVKTTMRPWTDDYSNFISTLRIFSHKEPDASQDTSNE